MNLPHLDAKISKGPVYTYTDRELLAHRYELKAAMKFVSAHYRDRLTKVNLAIVNRRYLLKKKNGS